MATRREYLEKPKEDYINDMLKDGADIEEAENAYKLFTILSLGLKIKPNGCIETTYGDKKPLGLYRTIRKNIFSK